MEDETTDGNKPGGDAAELEARGEEARAVIASGPGSGNRSAALGFLALLVVIAAALHFHFISGGAAYLNRLDAELINHAELSVAAMEDQNRMAVVPSWPLRLYDTLRRDIAVYAALAAAAAYVWSLASRARARRDAFVMHEKLNAELNGLRERLERLEKGGSSPESNADTKG